ncbi:MAG: methyl-accepting chemotaxis protein [Rhodobacteraceae bacterium]|nr:MAG: methyl-accepting chemotaxis protein [Paracoccaceae bacterium]
MEHIAIATGHRDHVKDNINAPAAAEYQRVTLAAIAAQSQDAARHASKSVDSISRITSQMKMLAINAKIEAARAGQIGRGFSIVADEVSNVGGQINDIACDIQAQLAKRLADLDAMVVAMDRQSASARLVDLAFTAVDTIDRNLYERTCDVRWWATDSAFVTALDRPDPDTRAYATKRLGVIIDAYNIYLDLWIADRDGEIVANARPAKFTVTGKSVSDLSWFGRALAQNSGDAFEAGEVVQSPYLSGRQTITYACAIRANGDKHGRVLGVMATCFDWEAQARGILTSLRMDDTMRKRNTRALLIDRDGWIIAASDDTAIKSGKITIPHGMDPHCGAFSEGGKLICYHATEGFETYKGLGWRGVILQDLP